MKIKQQHPDYYLGLMIGSSLDGIDSCIINATSLQLVAKKHYLINSSDTKSIINLCHTNTINLDELHACDQRLGYQLAGAANQLLESCSISPQAIGAIGVHGATIRHQPQQPYPYSLQLGNAHIIASQTGITTITDFRNRDMILGGQGAPLAPLFHRAFLKGQTHDCLLVNIGGIANITHLPASQLDKVTGFDSGPGNTLIDYCMQQFFEQKYDHNGNTARKGKIDKKLLRILINDPFFKKKSPKSTGRDKFNMEWVDQHIAKNNINISNQNRLTTLTALTAETIAQACSTLKKPIHNIYICGGGAHNTFLVKLIQQALPEAIICSTSNINIDPDFIEAMGFAWLAKQYIMQQALETTDVTGSEKPTILGTAYITF